MKEAKVDLYRPRGEDEASTVENEKTTEKTPLETLKNALVIDT
jgi:hypothetical protein